MVIRSVITSIWTVSQQPLPRKYFFASHQNAQDFSYVHPGKERNCETNFLVEGNIPAKI